MQISYHFYYLVLLAIMSAITSIGAWYWLTDPKTAVVPLTESLLNHYIFVIAALILCKSIKYSGEYFFFPIMLLIYCLFIVSLFIMGIHKLVIAPQILTSRTRLVLNDFNMSCDDTGKLILKPRPTT